MKEENKEYGVVVTHDYQVQIHGINCKDFLKPKNTTNTIGDYTVMELLQLPINPLNNEDLKKLLVTISEGFWGAETMISETAYIMKCTELVNRKKEITDLDFGWEDGNNYDCASDKDYNAFYSYVNKDWHENTTITNDGETYNWNGWKLSYIKERPLHRF